MSRDGHNMETLRFDLKRKEVALILSDENGQDQEAILREITGRDRDEYMNFIAKMVKIDGEGKPTSFSNTAGITTKLLKLSLFWKESGKRIKPEEFETWPAEVCEKLFYASQGLSQLGKSKKKEDPEGNG